MEQHPYWKWYHAVFDSIAGQDWRVAGMDGKTFYYVFPKSMKPANEEKY